MDGLVDLDLIATLLRRHLTAIKKDLLEQNVCVGGRHALVFRQPLVLWYVVNRRLKIQLRNVRRIELRCSLMDKIYEMVYYYESMI